MTEVFVVFNRVKQILLSKEIQTLGGEYWQLNKKLANCKYTTVQRFVWTVLGCLFHSEKTPAHVTTAQHAYAENRLSQEGQQRLSLGKQNINQFFSVECSWL